MTQFDVLPSWESSGSNCWQNQHGNVDVSSELPILVKSFESASPLRATVLVSWEWYFFLQRDKTMRMLS